MDRRTPNWTPAEIDLFIDLCFEKKIPELMDGKKFRNMEIFNSLREEMLDNGYDRTDMQLLIKYKQLKARYRAESLKCTTNGTGATSHWEHYEKMAELLRDCPLQSSPKAEQTIANCSNRGDTKKRKLNSPPDTERRKPNWTEAETAHFINLSIQKKIPSLMDGKKFRNLEIFNSLRMEMLKRGFNRSVIQLHMKFKQLKARYKAEMLRCEESGSVASDWTHYDKMAELLHGSNMESFLEDWKTESVPEFESIFVINQDGKKWSAANDTDSVKECSTEMRPENSKLKKPKDEKEEEEECSFATDTESMAEECAAEISSENSKAKKRKRSSFSSAFAEFSEKFFQRQKELNRQFLLELRELFREKREYSERASAENRIFLQNLLLRQSPPDKSESS